VGYLNMGLLKYNIGLLGVIVHVGYPRGYVMLFIYFKGYVAYLVAIVNYFKGYFRAYHKVP
jgi:hypothetical protein